MGGCNDDEEDKNKAILTLFGNHEAPECGWRFFWEAFTTKYQHCTGSVFFQKK